MNHSLYTIGKVKESILERTEEDELYKIAKPF
jgi:hypothetical protein